MQRHALFRGKSDNTAADVMGVAERHFQRPHQPVGKIGGGGIALARGGFHPRLVRHHVGDHSGHRPDRQRERAERFHRALLVLLHVLLIGQRKTLHHDQQCGQRADHPAGLGADQFGGVRIALLRHDRGARGELVG